MLLGLQPLMHFNRGKSSPENGPSVTTLAYYFTGSKAVHANFSHAYGLTLYLHRRDFEDFTNGWIVSVARLL